LLGPGLEGFADVEDAVHAGGIPGDGQLLEGLLGVVARGFRVTLGGFDGGQVSEDDGALLVVGGRCFVERGGQGLLGLGEMPSLELSVAFERRQPHGGEPGEPVRRGMLAAYGQDRFGVVGFPGGPVTVAKAYRLLHAIFETAAEDRIIARNPCRIAGAGQEESDERAIVPLPVVFKLAETVPVRYRTLILLATFADMRWGELVGLRRENVDLDACEIRITETLAQLDRGGLRPDTPKSRAGRRIVAFPAEIALEIRWHLERFAEPGPRGFVFVGPKGGQLRRSNFHRTWEKARTAVGLPDLHFHDLRHTGGTLTATTGATLKELMARLGHSSVRAALIYQHATRDRDQAIAKALGAYVREVRGPAERPGDEPERGEQGA
jgi:integrase